MRRGLGLLFRSSSDGLMEVMKCDGVKGWVNVMSQVPSPHFKGRITSDQSIE